MRRASAAVGLKHKRGANGNGPEAGAGSVLDGPRGVRLARRRPGPAVEVLEQRIDHPFGSERRGVDDHRILGPGERRFGAVAVGVIALAQVALDLLEGDGGAGFAKLGVAAPRPHRGVGVHVELELGVGKHLGADVAAVHHDAALLSEHPLARDHLAPDLRVHRDLRRRRAHLGRPDGGAHVLAVEAHPAGITGQELDLRIAKKLREWPRRPEVDAMAKSLQGESAVAWTSCSVSFVRNWSSTR